MKAGSGRRPTQISIVGKPGDMTLEQKHSYGVNRDTEEVEFVLGYAVFGTLPNSIKT